MKRLERFGMEEWGVALAEKVGASLQLSYLTLQSYSQEVSITWLRGRDERSVSTAIEA